MAPKRVMASVVMALCSYGSPSAWPRKNESDGPRLGGRLNPLEFWCKEKENGELRRSKKLPRPTENDSCRTGRPADAALVRAGCATGPSIENGRSIVDAPSAKCERLAAHTTITGSPHHYYSAIDAPSAKKCERLARAACAHPLGSGFWSLQSTGPSLLHATRAPYRAGNDRRASDSVASAYGAIDKAANAGIVGHNPVTADVYTPTMAKKKRQSRQRSSSQSRYVGQTRVTTKKK